MRATVASLGQTSVVVADVSRSGVAIETPVFFRRGRTETLHFTAAGVPLGDLRAEVISSRRIPGAAPCYLTGLAFLDDQSPDVQARIETLLAVAGGVSA